MAPRHGQYSRWRDGDGTDWPTEYNRPAEKWPTVNGHTWAPEHTGHAVVLCLRTGPTSGTEFVRLPTVEDARRLVAERNGQPCGEFCEGRHTLVHTSPGALHVEPCPFDAPVVPRGRAAALRAAGYVSPVGGTAASTVDRWPKPSILNQPFAPRGPDRD